MTFTNIDSARKEVSQYLPDALWLIYHRQVDEEMRLQVRRQIYLLKFKITQETKK